MNDSAGEIIPVSGHDGKTQTQNNSPIKYYYQSIAGCISLQDTALQIKYTGVMHFSPGFDTW